MTMGEADRDLRSLVADIVAAYVAGNQLPPSQLPEVICSVYDALAGVKGQVDAPTAEPLKPAVPIRKSVTPDFIVCLEDGKKLKMLRRHLRTTYDMTPESTGRSGAWRPTTRWSRRLRRPPVGVRQADRPRPQGFPGKTVVNEKRGKRARR